VWSDDNLSNDYFFTKLDADARFTIERDLRYGKVCCFKGFDSSSFAFNTAAAPELFDRQFALMRRLVMETTIDLYAYATFTGLDDNGMAGKISAFLDRLQEIDPNLPLRTVPLEVAVFSPVRGRLDDHRERSLGVQQAAIATWNTELEQRFSADLRSRPICDAALRV
jgi:hypothetical protein